MFVEGFNESLSPTEGKVEQWFHLISEENKCRILQSVYEL
jgi:hypothetical protein